MKEVRLGLCLSQKQREARIKQQLQMIIEKGEVFVPSPGLGAEGASVSSLRNVLPLRLCVFDYEHKQEIGAESYNRGVASTIIARLSRYEGRLIVMYLPKWLESCKDLFKKVDSKALVCSISSLGVVTFGMRSAELTGVPVRPTLAAMRYNIKQSILEGIPWYVPDTIDKHEARELLKFGKLEKKRYQEIAKKEKAKRVKALNTRVRQGMERIEWRRGADMFTAQYAPQSQRPQVVSPDSISQLNGLSRFVGNNRSDAGGSLNETDLARAVDQMRTRERQALAPEELEGIMW